VDYNLENLTMKYIILLALVLSISSCEKNLQDQLVEEFGEYEEVVKPKDREYYNAYDKTLTLWDTPFQEVNIQTSLGNTHVIVSGPRDAEPLVLLHGMNASSTMWYPNIKALSFNYRVYAIDYILEPGKSTMTGKIKGMSDIVNWYYEIFDQLKLKKFGLIGASEGGWLATKIALRQTSRIKDLTLLSPLQTFMSIPRSVEMSSDIIYALNPKHKNLGRLLKTMSVNVDNIEKAFVDQFFIASKQSKFNLKMFQMTPFSSDKLKTLTMPVLVLIGDKDIINKGKGIEKAKKILPHPETDIIKNAGHFLSMDQADIVNTRILDFLKVNRLTHAPDTLN
jgi:pimeloyl-ACP methyl ester carboxylesterase